MNISLTVGSNAEHRIEYTRNWFTGAEQLKADGKVIASRSVVSLSNYVSFPLCRRYEFTLGTDESLPVVFEKERPLLLAGLRPHTYRIFVAGKLVHERKGF